MPSPLAPRAGARPAERASRRHTSDTLSMSKQVYGRATAPSDDHVSSAESQGFKPRSPSSHGALHGGNKPYHGSALPTELRGQKTCKSGIRAGHEGSRAVHTAVILRAARKSTPRKPRRGTTRDSESGSIAAKCRARRYAGVARRETLLRFLILAVRHVRRWHARRRLWPWIVLCARATIQEPPGVLVVLAVTESRIWERRRWRSGREPSARGQPRATCRVSARSASPRGRRGIPARSISATTADNATSSSRARSSTRAPSAVYRWRRYVARSR
jgi:hypothetical protein